MDFLKAEIARKKRQIAESQVMPDDPNKKYFKRGDLLAHQEKVYLEKHKPKEKDIEHLQELKEVKTKNRGESKLIIAQWLYTAALCHYFRYKSVCRGLPIAAEGWSDS